MTPDASDPAAGPGLSLPTYDYRDVPVDLRVRWSRADPDQVIIDDLLLFFGFVAALLAGLSTAVIAVARHSFSAGLAALIMLLAAVGLRHRRRRAARRPGGFSEREIDRVLAGRAEVGFDGWSALPSLRVEVSDEQQLARRAGLLQANCAGTDRSMAVSTVGDAARSVTVDARRVWELRSELGSDPAADAGAPAELIAEWTWHSEVLDESLGRLAAHLDTLEWEFADEVERERQDAFRAELHRLQARQPATLSAVVGSVEHDLHRRTLDLLAGRAGFADRRGPGPSDSSGGPGQD